MSQTDDNTLRDPTEDTGESAPFQEELSTEAPGDINSEEDQRKKGVEEAISRTQIQMKANEQLLLTCLEEDVSESYRRHWQKNANGLFLLSVRLRKLRK